MPALTLLVIRSRDLEGSRTFYETLGLVFTPEQHGSGPRHYSSSLGSVVLELYPATEHSGTVRFGLGIVDVVQAVRSIRAVGGQVVREPTPDQPVALVRDPDGNIVQLS